MCNTRSGSAATLHRRARRIPSCRPRAKACTRSRSVRFMPASSSPGISASPPMARRSCGWKQRLGYVHKGIEGLMAGATLDEAARLAGRTSGDSTVAYALAYRPRCGSGARECRSPPRASHLRALMAELERLANHFGDIGADLQRRLVLAHARALRRSARADLAGGGCLLRPSADDGCRACPAASPVTSLPMA